jgi:hypothetical protein
MTHQKANARRKSNNRILTYQGKSQAVVQWAEEYHLPYSVLYDRLFRLNYSIERALLTPVQVRDERIDIDPALRIKVKELRAKGLTYGQINLQLGVSRSYAYNLCKPTGL